MDLRSCAPSRALAASPALAVLLPLLWSCAASTPQPKVLRLSTDEWSSVTLAGDHRLAALWTDPAGRLWAAGQGAVVRWDGSGPPEVTPLSAALTALWGSSATDVWAVGSDGARAHFDGKAWTLLPSAPTSAEAPSPLFAVWGSGSSDVWAAGETILRWDGRGWAPVQSPGALWIRGIWGSASNDVWLVAGSTPFAQPTGEILHWDGKSLTRALSTPEPLQAVWGSSAKDVWAVGAAPAREDAPARSVLRHFDGAAWSEVTSFAGVELVALWGTGPRDAWCAGPGGQAARYDGATWSTVPVGSRLDFAAGARLATTTWLLASSGELLSRDDGAARR